MGRDRGHASSSKPGAAGALRPPGHASSDSELQARRARRAGVTRGARATWPLPAGDMKRRKCHSASAHEIAKRDGRRGHGHFLACFRQIASGAEGGGWRPRAGRRRESQEEGRSSDSASIHAPEGAITALQQQRGHRERGLWNNPFLQQTFGVPAWTEHCPGCGQG